MQRSKRMKVVVEMAQRAEDDAAAQLAKSRQELDEELQRLNDLEHYYQEYDQRFQNTPAVRADQLSANRQFLQQLRDTCSAQGVQVKRAEHLLEAAKGYWRDQHLKHKNLKNYVEKLRAQEGAVREKLEQKLLDDWVSQSHQRSQERKL